MHNMWLLMEMPRIKKYISEKKIRHKQNCYAKASKMCYVTVSLQKSNTQIIWTFYLQARNTAFVLFPQVHA